jgi:hypothetical protein
MVMLEQLFYFSPVRTLIYQPLGSDVHLSRWLRRTSLPRGWQITVSTLWKVINCIMALVLITFPWCSSEIPLINFNIFNLSPILLKIYLCTCRLLGNDLITNAISFFLSLFLIKQLMTFHFGGHWVINHLKVMFTSAVGFGEHHFLGVDKSRCPPYEKSLIV